MSRRPVVIAYDICADATRRQVYKILLEWRLDGQKSVHECLLSPDEARELFIQLGQALDRHTDRLLLAWVSVPRPLYARGSGRVDSFFNKHLNMR